MVNYCIVTSSQPISDNLIRSVVEDIKFNKVIRLGACGVELQMNGNHDIELLRKKFYSKEATDNNLLKTFFISKLIISTIGKFDNKYKNTYCYKDIYSPA